MPPNYLIKAFFLLFLSITTIALLNSPTLSMHPLSANLTLLYRTAWAVGYTAHIVSRTVSMTCAAISLLHARAAAVATGLNDGWTASIRVPGY